MIRWIFAAAASVSLVGAGLVHGYWTDRWNPSTEVNQAAERFADIPIRFGDWEWEGKDIEVKRGQVGAGVAGCLQRRFIHRGSGQAVVIALVNGRPGPVATHTPEVCYGASGYVVGDKKAVGVGNDQTSQFWTSVAVKTRVTDETCLRLYWAWNGGDGWTAAADPRGQFARFRYPVLHKLYVLRDLSNHLPSGAAPGGEQTSTGRAKDSRSFPERDEVCEAFLKAFLPELDRTLFGNKGG